MKDSTGDDCVKIQKIHNILIIFLILLVFIVSFSTVNDPFDSFTEEEKQTARLLQALEEQDIKQINKEIAAARKKVQFENVSEKEAIKIRFQTAALIGDSVSEGMLNYRVLDSKHTFCKRGLRIDNSREYIDQALNMSPEVIFFQFGINDLEYCRGKVTRFTEAYKNQIAYVRSKDKTIRIYVNGILPIQQVAIDKIPEYKYVEKYNQALKEMCEELDCGFIDNEPLLSQLKNPYEQDGIHPRPNYYPLWAENMLKEAEL